MPPLVGSDESARSRRRRDPFPLFFPFLFPLSSALSRAPLFARLLNHEGSSLESDATLDRPDRRLERDSISAGDDAVAATTTTTQTLTL